MVIFYRYKRFSVVKNHYILWIYEFLIGRSVVMATRAVCIALFPSFGFYA